MINRDTVVASIEAPMEAYQQKMQQMVGDWKPLIGVSEKLLEGKKVANDEFPSLLLPLVEL